MNTIDRPWRIVAPWLLLTAACGLQAAQRNCEIRVELGLPYGQGLLEQGMQMPLQVDTYQPLLCAANPTEATPAIVLFPGGGYGDKVAARDSPPIVQMADGLARAGFAVFVAEHRPRYWHGFQSVSETKTEEELDELRRRAAEGPYPPESAVQGLIAAEDAFKLRQWIVAQAAAYQLDVARFGVIGPSSGASTALTMEYMGDNLALGQADMQALVDLWGDFYPHTDMQASESPLLVVIGTADQLVDYEETTDLMLRAAGEGIEASRITMPGVVHGLPAADIFNRQLLDSEMTIFEAIVQFFEAKLRPWPGQVWPPAGQGFEMVAATLPRKSR